MSYRNAFQNIIKGHAEARSRLSSNKRGLHPALIGLIIALVLGGLLFAGSKAGLFGFLTSGRDSNTHSTLNNVLSSAEAKWVGTSNSLHGSDWGYFSRPSNSNPTPFTSDTVITALEVAQIRYAECAVAKSLAVDEPELKFGFLEVATGTQPTTATDANRAGVAGTPAPDADGTDGPASFAIVEVTSNTICGKGGTTTPQELGLVGSATSSAGISITDTKSIVTAADLSDRLKSADIIWVDIHFGNTGLRDATTGILASSGVAAVVGTAATGSDVTPGATLVIGSRSASGNTFCIRRVFDGDNIGTYYQAVSEAWTNSWVEGLAYDWSANAFASCQVLPGSTSTAPQFGYDKGGFPEPFVG